MDIVNAQHKLYEPCKIQNHHNLQKDQICFNKKCNYERICVYCRLEQHKEHEAMQVDDWKKQIDTIKLPSTLQRECEQRIHDIINDIKKEIIMHTNQLIDNLSFSQEFKQNDDLLNKFKKMDNSIIDSETIEKINNIYLIYKDSVKQVPFKALDNIKSQKRNEIVQLFQKFLDDEEEQPMLFSGLKNINNVEESQYFNQLPNYRIPIQDENIDLHIEQAQLSQSLIENMQDIDQLQNEIKNLTSYIEQQQQEILQKELKIQELNSESQTFLQLINEKDELINKIENRLQLKNEEVQQLQQKLKEQEESKDENKDQKEPKDQNEIKDKEELNDKQEKKKKKQANRFKIQEDCKIRVHDLEILLDILIANLTKYNDDSYPTSIIEQLELVTKNLRLILGL